MDSICIITDNSAQFANTQFNGQSIVKIVHLKPCLHNKLHKGNEKRTLESLPEFVSGDLNPRLFAPSAEEFRQLFYRLGKQYNEIIGIFLSSHLSDCCKNAREANMIQRGGPKIQIIDSQTTSIGLGNMVQQTAEIVFNNGNLNDVERGLRSLAQRTYALFCTPNLSYLCNNGFIDHAQATIGEMTGILPLFALEEGQLVPVEKKKNPRHITAHFQEFIDEFECFQHVALIQSISANGHDARLIRDHIRDHFPDTPFTEHTLNLPLATLFGPDTTALVVIENADD
ncbi:MAG: DegV family protein [Anaerolineaceae bacterium]|jgi:DegV family protein with EDD domain|nr:DegV family protein [Anaerolineaceae bacterium]